MLIEQLNQTNLEKLTLPKRLKIRENFFDPKARNTTFKRSQQIIEQNIVPYYPIFRTPQ